MVPNNLKRSALRAIPFLLVLFFLGSGFAWCAEPTQSTPQKKPNNSVKASIPSKPGIPMTGTSAGITTQAVSPQKTGSNLNGAACPLDLSTGPKGDIRDIRGPINIPDPRIWLFYALGGILLALLAWAAWKWFRRHKFLSAKTAFEIAFEELEKAKGLMTPEMAERFSVMVSNTIRTYIEKRFQMGATRKTTHEFITQVAAEPSSELNPYGEALRDFLVHCDLAKFAQQTFSREQMKRMHKSAWRFVDETRPQPDKKTEKSAAPVNRNTIERETGKNRIKGKARAFKEGLKGVGFPKNKTGNQGFHNTHQVAAAGGR